MLKRIPKVLLLVALLAGFTASIAPAFGRAGACGCLPPSGVLGQFVSTQIIRINS